MSTPRRATVVIAALASGAIILVAGISVWRHMGGAGGDDPARRSAVIAPVSAAVGAAGQHSDMCAAGLVALTSGPDPTDAAIDRLETCGETARALAEAGYTALDAGAGTSGSERRAEYLDAAGSLLSLYEIQGDDFDVVFDMLHRARLAGTPLSSLASDVGYVLGNGAPDVAAARQEAARTEAAYAKGG